MKKYLLALFILASAIGASAETLEHSDFVGRVMIVNQAKANLMVLMTITDKGGHYKEVKIDGTVKGQKISCSGFSEYVASERTLLLRNLKCDDGQRATVHLDVRNIEIAPYKAGGLASAYLRIIKKNGAEIRNPIFLGNVDIKKLN